MELLTVAEAIEYAVVSQFLEGNLPIEEACERLKIHRSSLYRKVARLLKEGPKGLRHKLKGRPSNFATDPIVKKAICHLFEHEYKPYGFRVAHFYQEASDRFPEKIAYPTVVRWLKETNITTKAHKGWRHHSRRPRRESFGELIQMDTSIHDWLSIGKNMALVSAIDDATNVICGAALATGDTTLANMAVINGIIQKYGLFASLYVDKSPIFKVTRTGGMGRIIQPTLLMPPIKRTLGLDFLQTGIMPSVSLFFQNHPMPEADPT